MKKLYPKKILLLALQKEMLPFSYPQLIKYEKAGVVKRPKNSIIYPERSWRFYTQNEIDECIHAIRAYEKKQIQVRLNRKTQKNANLFR